MSSSLPILNDMLDPEKKQKPQPNPEKEKEKNKKEEMKRLAEKYKQKLMEQNNEEGRARRGYNWFLD